MGKKHSLLVLALFVAGACSNAPAKPAALVQGLAQDSELVLWAWHGQHDLRFLAERGPGARPVSVAYLARRLVVRPEGVEAQLRSKALHVPGDAKLTAVVRIEIAPGLAGEALTKALPQLVEHLAIAAAESDVKTLQIDFDAPARLRPQYRELLRSARIRLPAGHHLEMTALASWCLGDPWIDADLADAVVPMLFEMGPESSAIRERLQRIAALPEPCAGDVGVSTTDVLPPLLAAKRLFVFSPGPWTAERLEKVENGLATGRWEHKGSEGSDPRAK